MKNLFLLLPILVLLLCNCDNAAPKTKRVNKASKTSMPTSTELPKPVGVVNDFEAIFTKEQETILENLINRHKNFNGNQIVLVTTNNKLNYPTFETYANTLANAWGAGATDKNNGVMLIFSKTLGKLRIERGIGIAHKLTEEEVDVILMQKIVPLFNKNQFYEGSKVGLEAIIYELSKIDASQGTRRN